MLREAPSRPPVVWAFPVYSTLVSWLMVGIVLNDVEWTDNALAVDKHWSAAKYLTCVPRHGYCNVMCPVPPRTH